MGNGPVRGWPPTAVVTVVLAGGRIMEYNKPILAGDIMLRYPRHQVVRPDFFRSLVVLKPEEVLMPGNKFLLVPFHTVYKKLNTSVEVLHGSSIASPVASPAGAAYPRANQLGANIRDIMNCSRQVSVSSQCPEGKGLQGLAVRSPATATRSRTRSPAGHASMVSRKSSPTTTLQARKTLLHKEKVSRNSTRRPSMDSGDHARRRTLLPSQMLRQTAGELSAECKAQSKWLEFVDSMEFESFNLTDFVTCNLVEKSVTKQALSSDLSVPEYESFQTPLSSSRELTSQRTFPAVKERETFEAMDSSETGKGSMKLLLLTTPTSFKEHVSFKAMDSSATEESPSGPMLPTTVRPIKEHKPFQVMDCSESEKISREQLLSTTLTSVKQHEFFATMDTFESDKSLSEPLLQRPTAFPDRCPAVLGMKGRLKDSRGGESGLNHRAGDKDNSRFSKPPRPATSLEWQLKHEKVKLKIAEEAQEAISHIGRENGSTQQPLPGEKALGSQPERNSIGRSEPRAPVTSPRVYEKPSTPVHVTTPSVKLVKKRKPYGQKLMDHLCFSSTRYLQSPLHVPAAEGSQEFKQLKAHQLRLIDHLKRESSPPPQYLQKLYKQSPLHAHATKKNRSPLQQYRRLSTPQTGSDSRMDPKPQKELPVFQLSQADKNQWDPFVLGSDNVDQIGTPSIEENFLKVPPIALFRHRRIRTRRKVHTLASWKPKLSTLSEVTP